MSSILWDDFYPGSFMRRKFLLSGALAWGLKIRKTNEKESY